jgi:hypothetical protein
MIRHTQPRQRLEKGDLVVEVEVELKLNLNLMLPLAAR